MTAPRHVDAILALPREGRARAVVTAVRRRTYGVAAKAVVAGFLVGVACTLFAVWVVLP